MLAQVGVEVLQIPRDELIARWEGFVFWNLPVSRSASSWKLVADGCNPVGDGLICHGSDHNINSAKGIKANVQLICV